MWEKIKDLLYEISDLLLASAIILVMTTVITWKVTDSLAFTEKTAIGINEATPNEKVSNETKQASLEENNSLPTINEAANESSNENIISENEEKVQNIPDASSSEETTATPPQQIAPGPAIVKINIPSGTPGMGIAKILKEKELIDDTAKFISRIEELKLSSKLKSGTFNIQTNSSLDDIIYIITGKKRFFVK
ncbi:hypothetical protein [Crassaminicella indica]|uniref:Uncharacterized protein n=1 Tax=Crassaminicella indica TaxID=2855394 RepID=A0ABX8R976_9CLOT|nr:hypothetical protein [Crassaminicella indica]QXM05618.1 hypothetical protein KVH43_09570 [Crassaminicella indica]